MGVRLFLKRSVSYFENEYLFLKGQVFLWWILGGS